MSLTFGMVPTIEESINHYRETHNEQTDLFYHNATDHPGPLC